jgi:hypothetical protein
VDEDIISKQMEETEAIIAKEIADFEERYPPEPEEEDQEPEAQPDTGNSEPAHPDTDSKEAEETTVNATDTVGSAINRDSGTEIPRTDTTTTTPINGNTVSANIPVEDSRGHDYDGGEVVEEDKEDTVIY